MLRVVLFAAILVFSIANSEIIDKSLEQSGPIQDSSNFALAVNGEELPTDIALEGQSEVMIRAKRYYGCGCGCGCATVAAVSPVPCGGCCGCGYGK
ncbi:uncharacterized protein CELE_B0310.6 [Caenorhabditis elegans]|uniref:Uncharacterized protein B0310.6 n=1 Tax=Caenorhabditis elegans TaxID=6239 RepID=YWS6_CAEEL|nr:Uncharacterized protein CELE_B0310.6 [Caenorhabditis elegans]Q10942.1 RecName: Full=Uncharacterized protein B0310.6 [Caenorhabditis elegans]CCD61752.1 Uncharacterized protein CELE_B0310.6 [Caenorhabditis elegans]|eukprot:NP_001294825.1 Uncharacterized protein CELE_B0310.6 [Caenorhabditis elegans]